MPAPSRIDRRQMLLALASSIYTRRVLAAPSPSPRAGAFFTDAFLREQLPKWPDADRATLLQALSPENEGRIDAQTVERLVPAAGSVDALMTTLLAVVKKYARPPISKFEAGAIARGQTGALYAGANLEIPGIGLSLTIHAEQSAIANAFGHREAGIVGIAASDAPCGLCRQFLNEIADAESLRILTPQDPPQSLKTLLPASFGPKDLQQADTLFTARPHALRLPSGAGAPVVRAALEAAIRSYAPYSQSPSGCAIETKTGVIVSGSYLENAAFNPSFSPIQSALTALVMRQAAYSDIVRVALVESGGTISHAAETRIVVRALAPRAKLEIVTATRRT